MRTPGSQRLAGGAVVDLTRKTVAAHTVAEVLAGWVNVLPEGLLEDD